MNLQSLAFGRERRQPQSARSHFEQNSPFRFIAELLTESFNAVPVGLSVQRVGRFVCWSKAYRKFTMFSPAGLV